MARLYPARLIDVGLVLFLGLLWGVPYALTKISLASIPPLTITAGRVGLAAVALWALVAVLGREIPRGRRLVGPLFVQGCLACVIPYTLIAFGQRSVDSSLAAILNSSTPLFVCLIGVAWTKHEPISLVRGFGAALGLAGVVLVVGVSALAHSHVGVAGQIAIIAATACSAVSVIYGRRFAALPAEAVAASMLSCAAVILIPVALLVEHPWDTSPTVESVAAVAVNAIGTTALGFVIYFRLIRSVGALATSSTSFLKPLVGVSAGILLGESISTTMLVGLAAILLGLAAITKLVPSNALALCGQFSRRTYILILDCLKRSGISAHRLLHDAVRSGQQ